MGEILVIAVVALLFLGPEKLPEAAKSLSRGIRDLRRHTKELQKTIEEDTQVGGAIRDLKSALRGDHLSDPEEMLKRNDPNIPPANAEGEAKPEIQAGGPKTHKAIAAPSKPAVSTDEIDEDISLPKYQYGSDEPLIRPASETVATGDLPELSPTPAIEPVKSTDDKAHG